MAYIYNKVNKILKLGLLLCLMVLMPLQAYADYGIDGANTWHQQYLAKIAAGELSARGTSLDASFEKEVYNNKWHYLIKDVWDLCRLADLVNGGYEGNEGGVNAQKEYFRLDADIDLDGAVWYPIGVREGTYFAGYFDGNSHTIKHMNITVGDVTTGLYGDHYGYGLFGFMKGVIRNLNMKDAHVTISQTEDNLRSIFHIGLLCGYVGCTWDLMAGASGAIWGCDVVGEITGMVESSLQYYTNNHIGGMVGMISSPVSIYQSHAKVNFNISNCGSVGGIVGYIENGIRTNGYDTNDGISPKVSYLFDCTADVTMELTSYQKAVTCGGICGFNDGCNIVACASSGTIFCPAPSDASSLIGGIAGYNTQTIMNCVSLASIRTAYIAGGIVGRNCFIYGDRKSATIANCVYSGYLFGGSNAHGIVGELDNSGEMPVNCLFLGTQRKDTPNAPLWPGDENNADSYCDQNLYDDWYDRDEYRSFSELTSGDKTKMPFQNSVTVYIDWKARLDETETSVSYSAGSEWQYHEGFYPRIQVGSSNITNSKGDLYNVRDCVISRGADMMSDDSDLNTPKLFPAYAWLASVPAGIHNGLLAQHFDDALSLTAKEQDMESNGNVTKVKTAHFSLPADQTLFTVSGKTATPKENIQDGVVLTVTSSDEISKQFYLSVNTNRKWDQKIARTYDAGNGTSENPYIIHNARQLMRAFLSNEAGHYYKLKNDIWFNENLLTESGDISNTDAKWNHKESTYKSWKAHLDGDSHAIRGLYATSAISMLDSIGKNASLENVAFVDCAVQTSDNPVGLSGFLASKIEANAVVRNCLFDGLYLRMGEGLLAIGGLCYMLEGDAASMPTIEDCVVAVWAKGISPLFGLFNANEAVPTVKRILVLNNNIAQLGLTNTKTANTDCYFPAGYLLMNDDNSDLTKDAKAVAEMTDGTFFTGDGFDKWTVKKGRFPMLKSFAETAYGKLISLPVYTDKDNRFDKMNYLFDFTPGTATWQTTDATVLNVDTDIRVVEPKTTGSSTYLVRSLDGAKVITPITTGASLTAGIKFEDDEAKAFCVAHYDDNHDGEVSLSELKSVLLEEFQADMNEEDGDPNDNDGALITTFPEFRYFSGIEDLGTSFQDKDKLKTLEFSGKITELSDNDFKGNTSMTEFTIPTSITDVSGTAFYNSGLENYSVEVDHTKFAVADGVLFNKNQDQLVSIPNGRKDSRITIPDNVKSIASNAVYKMSALEHVYIDAADYDYETVVELADNAFTAAADKEITYYIEDATQDYADSDDEEEEEENARAFAASRRNNSKGKTVTTDGIGKGHLVSKYQESDFWVGKKIETFFKLEVSEKSKDADGNYWATMYIGFDTQLPEGLTPYIVDKQKTKQSESTLVLREISNKVRMMTPVVIRATKAGTYDLHPSKEAKRYHMYPMSENLLEGVDRNGLQVNQSDANDGGCLTLGKNKSGQVGFFIYKGTAKIPAFRAYLTVNKVGNAAGRSFSYADDETTGINSMVSVERPTGNDQWFNLQGQRVSQPSGGIFIKNGRKYVIK